MIIQKQKNIKAKIISFLNILWREHGQPQDIREKLKAFDVVNAINFLGYSVETVEEIPGGGIGYLNKVEKVVLVKSNLSSARKRFTLAHELTHILCHKDMDVYHREETYNQKRPAIEVEADYGASVFLTPDALVLKELIDILNRLSGVDSFLKVNPKDKSILITFNDDLSFFLNMSNPNELYSASKQTINEKRNCFSDFSYRYTSISCRNIWSKCRSNGNTFTGIRGSSLSIKGSFCP